MAALYLGGYIYSGIINPNDGVSRMGHIIGGVTGLVWGIIFYNKKFKMGGVTVEYSTKR